MADEILTTPPETPTPPTPPPNLKLATESSVVLKFPIDLGGVRVNKVTMRRPKVRDRLQMARGASTDAEMEALLIGNLCGIAPSELEEMDLLDYRMLQNTLESFTNPLQSKT